MLKLKESVSLVKDGVVRASGLLNVQAGEMVKFFLNVNISLVLVIFVTEAKIKAIFENFEEKKNKAKSIENRIRKLNSEMTIQRSTFFALSPKFKGQLFEKDIINKKIFINGLSKFNQTFFSNVMKSEVDLLANAMSFSRTNFEEIFKRDLLKNFPLKFYKSDLVNHFISQKTSKLNFAINTPERCDLGWIQEAHTINNLSKFPNISKILVISEKVKNKNMTELQESLLSTGQRMPDFLIIFEKAEDSTTSRYMDVKHGNVKINNSLNIQVLNLNKSTQICDSSVDQLEFIKKHEEIFSGYPRNDELNRLAEIMADPRISFVEKNNQKNEICLTLLANGCNKQFNPSLHFFFDSFENNNSFTEEQRNQLIDLCPNNIRNNAESRRFLNNFYKLEPEAIKKNISATDRTWLPSFLEGIDNTIFK